MITTPRVDALIELEVVRELKADALPSEADWFRREDDNPDEYYHGVTHRAWLAWQASRAAAIEEAAQACEEAVCCEDKGPDGVCCGQPRHQTADECAARIRAMGKP